MYEPIIYGNANTNYCYCYCYCYCIRQMKTIQKIFSSCWYFEVKLNLRFIVIMNFVLTNIEVFVVIVLLNKPKGTNTENYLREFKAARTSLAKLECANLKLNEN